VVSDREKDGPSKDSSYSVQNLLSLIAASDQQSLANYDLQGLTLRPPPKI
jgi:hypothetical protein